MSADPSYQFQLPPVGGGPVPPSASPAVPAASPASGQPPAGQTPAPDPWVTTRTNSPAGAAFSPVAAPVAPAAPAPQFRRKSGNMFLGLLMIGGGVLILLSLAIVAGLGWAFPGGGVSDGLWREQILATIEDSDIPRAEKSEMNGHINRLAADCASGQITREQLHSILERLENSPVFVAMDLGGIEREVFVQSGLSVDERQAARSTLVRAVRGVFAGKISIDDFYGALPPGYYVRAELTAFLSQQELDEYFAQLDAEPFQEASDAEVRKSLARLDQLTKDAGIRADVWTIDVGDELGKAIEAARASEVEGQKSQVGTQPATDN